MTRYATFNSEGRSTIITNVIPVDEESSYFAVPDSVEGALLVKEGNKIRDLSKAEIEQQTKEILVEFFSKQIREKRNGLLASADVLTQPDRWESYSPAQKKKISTYKQALRDITKQKGFPKDVTFPDMPE